MKCIICKESRIVIDLHLPNLEKTCLQCDGTGIDKLNTEIKPLLKQRKKSRNTCNPTSLKKEVFVILSFVLILFIIYISVWGTWV